VGRKVHPIGFRLGVIKDWQSRWYAEKDYPTQLMEDFKLREMIAKRLKNAALSKIEIQRSSNNLEVTLHTAKPGIVIGKSGQEVDKLKKEIEDDVNGGKVDANGNKAIKVKLNIEEIRQPELDAYLVAESIGEQISKRVNYKRAMKQAVTRAMRLGAKGVKIKVSGRLAGAEMARNSMEKDGRIPLHTIRADIDYGVVHAYTTYGRIGVKVWIYRGDVLPSQMKKPAPMPRVVADEDVA
jgi:small subunit ribosomal protein S3